MTDTTALTRFSFLRYKYMDLPISLAGRHMYLPISKEGRHIDLPIMSRQAHGPGFVRSRADTERTF